MMLGIIGANGVAATNRLCELIEEGITKRGAFRDAHHPEMVIYQASKVPSRSLFLEGRGPSFIPGYVEVGEKLKSCGCTELCMCCNTAYYAVEELEKEIGLPFINIIDEVAIAAKKAGVKRVGIMCGDGCRKANLYDKSFARIYPECQIFYPSDEGQRNVTAGICAAKTRIRFCTEKDAQTPAFFFTNVFDELVSKNGVDAIIAGCTDINNVFQNPQIPGVEYLDCLEILADKIIEKYDAKEYRH